MRNKDYVPGKDVDFDIFQLILYAAIVAHGPLTPAPWGYPQTRIDLLAGFKLVWDAKWLIAKDEENSTPAQKTAKTVARRNYVKEMRQFVQEFLINNSLITEEQMQGMGLPLHDTNPTRIDPLNYAPDVSINTIREGLHILRLENPATPDSNRMPDGNKVELQLFIGAAGLPDAQLIFATYKISGKFLTKVLFELSAKGKTAYYRARYITNRGEGGIWSPIMKETIA